MSVALVGAGALAGVGLMLLLPARAGGEGILARLASVAAVYRSRPRLLLGTGLLSFLVQAASVALVAACGAALGLPVPPLYYAVMVPLVTLLTLLPISINGMGLREMGFTLFLCAPHPRWGSTRLRRSASGCCRSPPRHCRPSAAPS